ncbi:hypothetical protein LguiB_005953 [Lonicera macranthoides]
MKPRWMISNWPSLPNWASSLTSPSKTLISPHRFAYSEQSSTFVLNNVDLSFLLSNCAKQGQLHLGSSIHASIIKNSVYNRPISDIDLRISLVVWNSLLNMYAKCGQLSDAAKVFDHMPVRDTISWNSIVPGFLRNGKLETGLEYFKRLYGLGVYYLDQATLTTILSSCD